MPIGAAVASGRGVLDRIANPPAVNPLAIAQNAAQAANTVYDLKGKQADQAWGEALQQATDENGNVDYKKAQALAAHNPFATQGMLRALGETSRLTGEQQTNIRSNMATVAAHAATLGIDPSDANVNAIVDGLKSDGMPARQAEALRSHLLSMRLPDGSPDFAQRQQFGGRVQLGAMDAVNAANRATGQMKPEQFGGVTAPTIQTQPVPGYSGGGMIVGPATSHFSPNDMVTVYDANGKVVGLVPRGTLPVMPGTPGAAGSAPASNAPPQGKPPPTTPPPIPAPGTVPSQGRLHAPAGHSSASDLPPVAQNDTGPPATVQVASMDSSFAPSVGAPGAPSPAVAGDVNAMLSGINAARGGGAPPVRQAAYVPAAPSNVMPYQATQGAPVPVTPTQAPIGVTESINEDVKARNADAANITNQRTQVDNMKSAYDALQAISTGPTANARNTLRRLGAEWGLLSPGQDVTAENFDIFKKKVTTYILQQAQTWGGTDLSRSLSGSANPDVELSKPANIKILRDDIGTKLRDMAAPSAEDMKPETATGYLGRKRDVANQLDYRGFAWPLYTDDERQQIINSTLDKNGNETAATHKIYKAITRGHQLGLTVQPAMPLTQPTTGANP